VSVAIRTYIHQVSSISLRLSSSRSFLIVSSRSFFSCLSIVERAIEFYMFKTLLKFLLLLRWSLFGLTVFMNELIYYDPIINLLSVRFPSITARFLLTWKHFHYFKKEHEMRMNFEFLARCYVMGR